ncbi:MAG TPA: hypothetical protein PLR83_11635, partial [Pyrinomonadaceae bacterium]|nr:hypothetical protein [Pyrinomonadaceae bacterium]
MSSAKGTKKTAVKPEKVDSNTFLDVDEAIREYEDRKASQLKAIKKVDKETLREMLYQMVLGRHFEEKCA